MAMFFSLFLSIVLSSENTHTIFNIVLAVPFCIMPRFRNSSLGQLETKNSNAPGIGSALGRYYPVPLVGYFWVYEDVEYWFILVYWFSENMIGACKTVCSTPLSCSNGSGCVNNPCGPGVVCTSCCNSCFLRICGLQHWRRNSLIASLLADDLLCIYF